MKNRAGAQCPCPVFSERISGMKEKQIELLAPAGDPERLRLAVLYGADAVYLAGTTFGMRSFAGNFEDDGALEEAVRFAHSHGVRVHVLSLIHI